MQQTLQDGAAQAHAIFEGTVTKIGENTQTDFGGREICFPGQPRLEGDCDGHRIRDHRVNGAACGYPFVEGQTYLVYAYVTKTPRLRVSLCSLTKPIDKAQDDLKHLGKPQRDFTGPTEKEKRPGRSCGAHHGSMGIEAPGLGALFLALFAGPSCRSARKAQRAEKEEAPPQ